MSRIDSYLAAADTITTARTIGRVVDRLTAAGDRHAVDVIGRMSRLELRTLAALEQADPYPFLSTGQARDHSGTPTQEAA